MYSIGGERCEVRGVDEDWGGASNRLSCCGTDGEGEVGE